MTEHTELPWSIDDDGDVLYIWAEAVKDYVAVVKEFGWSAPMQANAEFIIKAVNSYDATQDILTDIWFHFSATDDPTLRSLADRARALVGRVSNP